MGCCSSAATTQAVQEPQTRPRPLLEEQPSGKAASDEVSGCSPSSGSRPQTYRALRQVADAAVTSTALPPGSPTAHDDEVNCSSPKAPSNQSEATKSDAQDDFSDLPPLRPLALSACGKGKPKAGDYDGLPSLVPLPPILQPPPAPPELPETKKVRAPAPGYPPGWSAGKGTQRGSVTAKGQGRGKGSLPPESSESGQIRQPRSHAEQALLALGGSPYKKGDFSDSSDDDEEDLVSRHRRTGAKAFPQVEVAFATRKLLLTWARWGRNSLRIQKEEKLKALQHVRYPRTVPIVISPQPTPQSTPRGNSGRSAPAALTPAKSLLAERSRWAASAGNPVGRGELARRQPGGDKRSFLFDTLKEEQQEEMDAQDMKLKLCSKFGVDPKASTPSSSTPGFGQETPNFVGAQSRGSASASIAASIMSSGVASPQANGQVSPWLLEAEALVCNTSEEEDNVDVLKTGKEKVKTLAAWGFAPEAVTLPNTYVGGGGNQSRSSFGGGGLAICKEEELEEAIEDDDELGQVGVFVHSPQTNAVEVSASPSLRTAASFEEPRYSTRPSKAPEQPQAVYASSPKSSASPASTGNKEAAVDAILKQLPQYSPGQAVKYWSGSKGIWMPARIVERKSATVYLVDKQMRGCFSKVKITELMSAEEEKRNRILKAMSVFSEDDGDESEEEARVRPRALPQKTVPTHKDAARRKDNSRSPRHVRSPTSAAATTVGSISSSGRVSERSSSRSPKQGLHSHPPAMEFSPRIRQPTPPKHMGRIVRDDFSDSSEDDMPVAQPISPVPRPHIPDRPSAPTPRSGRAVRDDFSSDSDADG
eukprot:TRINITY_DN36194_c0_g1_i1.p1 TRINITY_DN36194_c0_g1~~TRINITY_DN36194_c0_g1_i1.p1  ORF type:complete len:819 (+),score=160.10 TRINITY_DN36194_c0_g1_i1:285-2741(+)